MKINNLLTGVLAFAAIAVVTGCASHVAMPRIVVPNTTINGLPARMDMDTGASSTVLFDSAARRMGLKSGGMSDPVKVAVGEQTFTAPIPIFHNHIQWFYRLAFVWARNSLDGLIGWPEIRDNILVFDADKRMVRSVDQLPPETAGWLKLKVIPNPWLLLEVPLADGNKGTLEVDTGAPFGIQMPAEQWAQWTTAHREARPTSHWGGIASFGIGVYHVAWADNFNLGTLPLTDVPLQDMMTSEAAFLQRQAPGAKAVWTLGLYGLMRMDLIVDGKNGWAYLRARPSPGPPYPGVKRPNAAGELSVATIAGMNWTVANNVHLSSKNLFADSADYKLARNDVAGAIADYTSAVETDPRNAEAWSARGYLKTSQGDTTGSIADYTRALEIDPTNTEPYLHRAVAYEIRGDFSDAISDYDKFIESRPDEADYARLYRHTLLIRLGREEDMSKFSAGLKQRWTKTAGQFLAGALDEKALLGEAKRSDQEPAAGQKCEALYFIGMTRLLRGDNNGARIAFQKCRATAMKDYDEYQFAGAELARLDATALR